MSNVGGKFMELRRFAYFCKFKNICEITKVFHSRELIFRAPADIDSSLRPGQSGTLDPAKVKCIACFICPCF
jgi:hypothetical protein